MNRILITGFCLCVVACRTNSTEEVVEAPPILLEKQAIQFSLINQNQDTITQDFIKEKVYVVDFFFTSCPATCPKVNQELQKVYQQFRNEDAFCILSHTLDPKRDTPEALKAYAQKSNAEAPVWEFLTGPKAEIYDLANINYHTVAYQDSAFANGEIMHKGLLVLVDRQLQIRGMYNGLDPADTQRLMKDIRYLLQ